MRLTATITLLNLLVFASFAQNTFTAKRITVNDGLPQGFVSGIVQDDDGFIWLGTRDGLARYDGHEFKVFYSSDKRPTNISSNVITTLYRDHKNRIWIIHESKAIDVFYPHEERFESFTTDSVYRQVFKQFSPNFIRVDAHDQVWLIDPGNGLWKINLNKHSVQHLSRNDTGLLCDTIRGVIETPDKRCWIFMQKGIQQIDHRNKVIRTIPFDFPGSPDVNVNRNFAAGLAIVDERYVLVRELNKAFIFDTHLYSLEELAADSDRPKNNLDAAVDPQKDASGNLYFELAQSLYKYDSGKRVTKIWEGELEHTQSFFIDRSDVAWFGNSASGVQILNLASLPFRSSPYTSGFFVDMLRQLGIVPDKGQWSNYTQLPAYTRDVRTRYDYDNNSNLWMTFGDNAARIDTKTITFTELKPLQGEDPAFYYSPMTVANDTCWRVSSLTGNPVFYDNRNAEWVYPLGRAWRLPEGTNILNVTKIHNTLWATTRHDGLLAINLTTGKTQWHTQMSTAGSWPTDELTDIEPDPSNDSIVWIGTRAGLVRFNMNTAGVRTFSIKEGLPNNMIYCVAADRKGFLWLSTNKGLCRFDPGSFAVRNFSGSDGLQGDEFNSFHEFVLPDGRIAFGGTAGITVFDPQRINDDTFQPAVQLTKVNINNKEIDAASNSDKFRNPPGEPAMLHLAYDQNFFTFYFAGLQFNSVEKIQHRYRLIGLDKDWNFAGNLGMANYTKVPPGKYILELNASNTTGVWSSNVKRIFITIDPPLWKTPAAYVLYAMLLIGGVVGYIRYATNKIRLENLVALRDKEAQQLRQLDEVKSRFFTNITHEFRTPLTLILSPLQQLLKTRELRESQKKQLQTIQQNADQLLQLINQILELSKLEVGALQVSTSPVSINIFLERLMTPFHSIASHKQLTLHFESELGNEAYFIDESKLERIINNLLGNAIKFTSAGGSVKLMVSKQTGAAEDLITFTITDTGIGISSDALPFIFDRFYQADDHSNRVYEGTGIGLSLVKELTHLLKGTITVESTLGKGAIFTVVLPLSPAIGANPLISHDLRTISLPQDVVVLNTAREVNAVSNAESPLVLVVEDNDSLRDFLSEQLSCSYSVITAPNGKEAWQKIEHDLPDLIITDLMMPYMDGITLSKKVREAEATSHIGLIMLTAKSSAGSRLEGLQTGVNDYISKPFNFDELQLRVANLLAHQKRQRDYFYSQLVKNEASTPAEVENAFLKKAYQFLDFSLAQKTAIGVEDLADHLNISSRTLNRKLTALLGLSANELIRNYRLKQATILLKQGLTISEVAYQVGFESSQYFAQCFKALYSATPTEYQKRSMEKAAQTTGLPATPGT